MKHVIIGAGPAGVIAAETVLQAAARRRDLIGDEPEAPYSRMAIPILLIGNIGESGAPAAHARNHYGSEPHLQRGRARIDRGHAGARSRSTTARWPTTAC